MKSKIVKSLIIFAISFAVLFLGRFLYQWFNPATSSPGSTYFYGNMNEEQSINTSDNISVKRNFASYKLKSTSTTTVNQAQIQNDQKYEKVASMTSHSDDFDKDSQNLRSTISNYQAVIQYENKTGLKPNRSLYLQIGVFPDMFDAFLEEMQKVGTLSSLNISKTDQTSEFKKLAAKKISLENTRRSLLALKSRGGTIKDLMQLEEKLQAVEQEIQELGVNLGDFSVENEFCTVRFNLSEQRIVLRNPLVILWSAFTWTVKALLAIMGVLVFASLTGLLVMAILQKLKWLPAYALEQLKKKA